ncbi:MAG: hypothetical protein Q7S06_03510 [Nanoarchaeota archaeon]|nr:hypothetical protein [Nanoarchaeota archaeon]
MEGLLKQYADFAVKCLSVGVRGLAGAAVLAGGCYIAKGINGYIRFRKMNNEILRMTKEYSREEKNLPLSQEEYFN